MVAEIRRHRSGILGRGQRLVRRFSPQDARLLKRLSKSEKKWIFGVQFPGNWVKFFYHFKDTITIFSKFQIFFRNDCGILQAQMTRDDSLDVREKKGTVPADEFPKWITSMIVLSGVCIRIDLITVIYSPLTYCPQSGLSGPEIPDDSGAWTRLQNCTFSHEIDYFHPFSIWGHFSEPDLVISRFGEPWYNFCIIFGRKCRYLLNFIIAS